MADEPSMSRRTFVRAAGIDALRAAVTVVDASRAIQAAGIRAALGIDEQAVASSEAAGGVFTPTETEARTKPDVTSDGAALARLLRGHLVGDGPTLGPIAVHALAGTAAELVEQDGVARTNALRATAAILATILPASATLELALRRAEAVWAPLADTDAPTIAGSLTVLAKATTAEVVLGNRQLATRLAVHVLPAVSSERGVLLCGPWATRSTGSPSLARQFATALHAAGADPIQWLPEGRPVADGQHTASDLAEAEVPCRVIADASVAAMLAAGMIGVIVVAPHRVTEVGSVVAPLGTYQIAVMAALHGVPLVVAASWTVLPAVSAGEPPTLGPWTPSVSPDRSDARWLELVPGIATPVDEIPPELITLVVSDDGPPAPPGP
jgi:methylthioribose-1-phosphate isomerase